MAILNEIYQRVYDHRRSLNGRENFLDSVTERARVE